MHKLSVIIMFLLFFASGVSAQEEKETEGKKEITGQILSKKSAVVKMQCDADSLLPQLNNRGELSKWFERELFGGLVTGWMSIGKMKVTDVSGNTITFLLEEELSVVYENGKKKDHFPVGQKVKFNW